jgi:hypothetical protein
MASFTLCVILCVCVRVCVCGWVGECVCRGFLNVLSFQHVRDGA